jgi:2-iminobutanoate/2-iminopropanoate deaminase
MSSPRIVATESAPAAVGPYSQAVLHDGTLYCSGAIPLDPATGELVEGPIGEQARRCLENLEAICAAAGTGLERALQLTIYATDLGQFGEINEAYAAYFAAAEHLPARVTVGVAALPLGAPVEISAIVAA